MTDYETMSEPIASSTDVTEPRIEYRIGAPNSPVLRSFIASRGRVDIIIGPLGSGKTFGTCQRILKQMTEQEPNARGLRMTRWVAIRNTYPDLATTTIKDFLAVFAPPDGQHLGEMRWGGLEPPTFRAWWRCPDDTRVEAEVIFLALDREDAVRKVRGLQVTGVWLNETRELAKPVVDMLDLRHGRYPSQPDGGALPSWHGMLGDTNSFDEDHWLYALAEESRPEGWTFFKQPGGVLRVGERWEPNPAAENIANLPEGYYVRGVAGKREDWIKVNLANEYGFTIDGKAVHPEYVDSVHTAPSVIEPDARYPLILGFDFGRTPAMAICQRFDAIGRWVVIDELTSEDMSAQSFAPQAKLYLASRYREHQILGGWGDPAGDHSGETVDETPMMVLRAHGVPCAPAPTNDPLLRRTALSGAATRLCMDGRPALIVSPRARMIRKGLMGGFCYRRLKLAGEDRYTDQPDKNQYSHPVEALEYAMLGAGELRSALPRTNRVPRPAMARM